MSSWSLIREIGLPAVMRRAIAVEVQWFLREFRVAVLGAVAGAADLGGRVEIVLPELSKYACHVARAEIRDMTIRRDLVANVCGYGVVQAVNFLCMVAVTVVVVNVGRQWSVFADLRDVARYVTYVVRAAALGASPVPQVVRSFASVSFAPDEAVVVSEVLGLPGKFFHVIVELGRRVLAGVTAWIRDFAFLFHRLIRVGRDFVRPFFICVGRLVSLVLLVDRGRRYSYGRYHYHVLVSSSFVCLCF